MTANSLDAAAVAILFSTFYAAYARWSLISVTFAFFLLALVAAVAVLLSIRRDSLFIALLGLVGGFATPALVSTGQDHPYALFGYLLILNAGLSWVGYRKKWPYLVGLSLLFTTIYQWNWVLTFLTDAKLPLAVGIFLVFPLLGGVALAAGQPGPPADARESLFAQFAGAGACLPLLFALYLAASPAYAAHASLLFAYLLILDIGLFAVAVTRGPELFHVIGGGATVIVAWTWVTAAYRPSSGIDAWPTVLVFIALFVAFYLAAPFAARRIRAPFADLGSHGVLAAPAMLFMFPVLAAVEPACAEPGLLFAVLFVLMAAIAWTAVSTRRGSLHFIAAFFALAAEAVWSARYLTPERLLAGLTLYGIFGLFYLAVPLVARRVGKPFAPEGAAGILLLASLALLFFLGEGSVSPSSLWGMALLLALLNLALFIEGSTSRAPLVAAAGSVLSWLVLAFWWATAPVGTVLLPAVIVVAGFAVLTLGGQIWLAKNADAATAETPRAAMFLALVGHLFLLFVAARPDLAVPPWPMIGVLAVLDLAIGAAALYARRGELHVAAITATQIILVTWVTVAGDAPWPTVAIVTSGAFVALACAWIALARRLAIRSQIFDSAAVTAVIGAQAVVLFAAFQPGSPGVPVLSAAHVAFLAALLALATSAPLALPRDRRHDPAGAGGRPVAGCASRRRALARRPAPRPADLPDVRCLPARARQADGGRDRAVPGGSPGQRPVLLRRSAGDARWRPLEHHRRAAGLPGGAHGRAARAAPPRRAAGRAQDRPPGARGRHGAGVRHRRHPAPAREGVDHHRWALEGAALAWLFREDPAPRPPTGRPSRLLAVVFVRLALNPRCSCTSPAERCGSGTGTSTRTSSRRRRCCSPRGRWSKTDDETLPGLPRASTLLKAGARFSSSCCSTSRSPTSSRRARPSPSTSRRTLAQDLTYTLGWGVFGVGLLAVGIVLRSHPARIAALALLVVTVVKCFLHDLARLTGLYRVGLVRRPRDLPGARGRRAAEVRAGEAGGEPPMNPRTRGCGSLRSRRGRDRGGPGPCPGRPWSVPIRARGAARRSRSEPAGARSSARRRRPAVQDRRRPRGGRPLGSPPLRRLGPRGAVPPHRACRAGAVLGEAARSCRLPQRRRPAGSKWTSGACRRWTACGSRACPRRS